MSRPIPPTQKTRNWPSFYEAFIHKGQRATSLITNQTSSVCASTSCHRSTFIRRLPLCSGSCCGRLLRIRTHVRLKPPGPKAGGLFRSADGNVGGLAIRSDEDGGHGAGEEPDNGCAKESGAIP